MSTRQLLALLPLLALGCTSHPLTTDSAEIAVTTEVRATPSGSEVSFRVRNGTDVPVYLARCGERVSAAIDRWEGGRWVEHSSDVCIAILPMDPLSLAPGAVAQGVRTLQLAGRFRLRLGVSRQPDEAPAWNVESPAFSTDR